MRGVKEHKRIDQRDNLERDEVDIIKGLPGALATSVVLLADELSVLMSALRNMSTRFESLCDRSTSAYDGSPCMLDRGGTPPMKPLEAIR